MVKYGGLFSRKSLVLGIIALFGAVMFFSAFGEESFESWMNPILGYESNDHYPIRFYSYMSTTTYDYLSTTTIPMTSTTDVCQNWGYGCQSTTTTTSSTTTTTLCEPCSDITIECMDEISFEDKCGSGVLACAGFWYETECTMYLKAGETGQCHLCDDTCMYFEVATINVVSSEQFFNANKCWEFDESLDHVLGCCVGLHEAAHLCFPEVPDNYGSLACHEKNSFISEIQCLKNVYDSKCKASGGFNSEECAQICQRQLDTSIYLGWADCMCDKYEDTTYPLSLSYVSCCKCIGSCSNKESILGRMSAECATEYENYQDEHFTSICEGVSEGGSYSCNNFGVDQPFSIKDCHGSCCLKSTIEYLDPYLYNPITHLYNQRTLGPIGTACTSMISQSSCESDGSEWLGYSNPICPDNDPCARVCCPTVRDEDSGEYVRTGDCTLNNEFDCLYVWRPHPELIGYDVPFNTFYEYKSGYDSCDNNPCSTTTTISTTTTTSSSTSTTTTTTNPVPCADSFFDTPRCKGNCPQGQVCEITGNLDELCRCVTDTCDDAACSAGVMDYVCDGLGWSTALCDANCRTCISISPDCTEVDTPGINMPDDYQQGCDETNIGAMNTVPCRCCNPDFVGDAVTIECVTPCPSCTIGVWEYYQDETCEGGTQAMHIGDSCDLEEMLFVRQMPTICVCNT